MRLRLTLCSPLPHTHAPDAEELALQGYGTIWGDGMGMTAMRGVVAAGSVVVAAAVNVATGMLTQNWAAAWWACTAVLVLLGALLAVWQAKSGDAASRRQLIRDTESASASQTMSGPGDQVVRGAKIQGDLNQRQEG